MKTFLQALLFLVALASGTALPAEETAAPQGSRQGSIADASSSAPALGRALAREAIARELRKGGYVVYFRHTATDFSQTDENMKDYSDCANQRLLSAKGRDIARAIGERVRALGLPVTEVLASPYCRTMDTARLIFGRAEPRAEIREGESGDYPGLKRLLATPVPPGSIRWIVGHGIPFRAIAGPPHLAEGEAAVIRPEGDRWTVVARILPQEWAGLRNKTGSH